MSLRQSLAWSRHTLSVCNVLTLLPTSPEYERLLEFQSYGVNKISALVTYAGSIWESKSHQGEPLLEVLHDLVQALTCFYIKVFEEILQCLLITL